MPSAAAVPRPSATGERPSPSGPSSDVTLDTPLSRGPRRTRAIHVVVPALFAAGLYAVACPPYGWWLAAWTVPALILLPTRGLGVARAALCGSLFGVALGFGFTPWLLHASLEFFAFDRVRATGIVMLLWLVLGSPFALLTAAHAVIADRVPLWGRPAVGAWLWAGMELVRTVVLGMPWELLGHTQFRNLWLIQIADLGGVYAVSFVMAFVSLALGEMLVARDRGRARAAVGLAIACGLLAATLGYGVVAMRVQAGTPDHARARTVAVVQGNVPNEFRWKRVHFQRVAAIYAQLSTSAARAGVDLIVWPENAVNFYFDREPMLRALVAPSARLARDGLLLGAPRLTDGGTAHNAAYLLASDGTVAAIYDKQRLLPLAEADPLGRARAARPEAPVYAPGGPGGVLVAGTTKIGAVICYEVLLPSLVRDRLRDGAELLVNLANDAWLDPGDGAALRQHFSMSVFRAVEARRFLVRAAGTGISAIVDPTGAIQATIPAGEAGSLVGRVLLRDGLTPYVRFGDAWLAAVGLALAALVTRMRA
jgi:apolipoprotein N-acyltransferase